jgi:hypothetical protein
LKTFDFKEIAGLILVLIKKFQTKKANLKIFNTAKILPMQQFRGKNGGI